MGRLENRFFYSLVKRLLLSSDRSFTRMELSPQIASLVCIFIGLSSAAYLVWTLLRQHASNNWPTATGEIIESQLEEDSDGWGPRVRYEYTVESKRYSSDRLYFYVSNSGTAQNAKKHISPYPVGKKIMVYYNPHRREDAVLDRRVPLWRPLFFVLFTAFFLIAGVEMISSAAVS